MRSDGIVNQHTYCSVTGEPLLIERTGDAAGPGARKFSISDSAGAVLDYFSLAEYLQIVQAPGAIIRGRKVINW